ncbi:MAG: glycoside hydrolase family 2 TIM barrel-domain containing protein [Planctomycetota bacterium]
MSVRRFILCLLVVLSLPLAAPAQPIEVELRQTDSGWQLLRGGEPFRIRGAGGLEQLELLADCGGNSIRTWGVGDDTLALLDEAHAHGIAVTLGIWIEHERHGFDYRDFDSVAQQFEQVREAVLAYKDHPAVLMWGIGNEMEGYEEGSDPAIWSHIEACAALVKRLDPHHPTMTVIAEIGGRKVEAINRLCPSIDIIGVNSYGGAPSVPERYASLGSDKPYIVTEFGPLGPWEIGRTSFGAAEEATSTQKAEMYRAAYAAIDADRVNGLGSYAFLWGSKIESTPTWFGMFLADGSKTNTVDAMAECWSGQTPDNLCPAIEPLSMTSDSTTDPGGQVRVELVASDPEGGALTATWMLISDAMEYVTGGDVIAEPKRFPGLIVECDTSGCVIMLPEHPGVYRLCVVVKDAAGNAATANVPLHVANNDPIESEEVDLPAVVYAEADETMLWTPSGFMGKTDAIRMNPECAEQPHAGETCLQVEYVANGEWGGVVWQSPADDWGDKEGGYDLSGARVLEFWARGEAGGEVVNFGYGILGADKAFPDTYKGELGGIELSTEWRRYTIEIPADADLRRIKTGFFWSLAGQGEPVTFYLDDIAFRTQATED